MKKTNLKAIAAASTATVALSCFMTSCEGRKMSNMEPTGETVEVNVNRSRDRDYDRDEFYNLPEDDFITTANDSDSSPRHRLWDIEDEFDPRDIPR